MNDAIARIIGSPQAIALRAAAATVFAANGLAVVDQTGVLGAFDVKRTWSPDEFQVPGPAEVGRAEAANPGGPYAKMFLTCATWRITFMG